MMRSPTLFLVLLCSVIAGIPGPEALAEVSAKASSEASSELEILFEGRREVKASRLKKAIAADLEEFRKDPRSSYLDDAAFEIASLYRQLGYAAAEVEFERQPPTRRGGPLSLPRKVIFHIEEGPRAEISEIRFDGNPSYSRKELLTFFPSAQDGLLGLDSAVYSRRKLLTEAETLKAFYRGNGFLDAEVGPPEVEFENGGRRARILVPVREGIRYVLESVELRGCDSISEKSRAALQAAFVGAPYHPRYPFEIRGRIEDAFAKEGHADAQIRLEKSVDSATGRVRLTVHADPGPEIFISRVEIDGNQRTRESFIRSHLAFEPGQRYSLDRERESFRRLYRTGLFRSVRLSLGEALGEGEGSQRPLRIQVDEYATREYFVEPGFGSYEGLRLRLGLKERNLFGGGSRLRADVTAAQRALRGRATYSDPWRILEDVTTEISLEADQRELDGFTSAKYGAGVSLTKDWTDQFSSSLGYQFRRSESQDFATEDLRDISREDVDISSLRLTSRYDDRDNLFAPHSGNLAELSLEYATAPLGSELEFFRFHLSASTYAPLGKKTTFAAGLRAGAIYPVRTQDRVPLQERFFSGGENSVRAFKENDLLAIGADGVPRVDADGNSQGGEAFATLTLELRRPIWGNLEGALFVDSGTLVPDASQLLDPFEIRTGVGTGLRYLLPIGPLRLDGAWNTNPGPGEDSFVLHFSVGMAI